MPVIPSHRGSLPVPDFSGAWLGGQNLQLKQQELQQSAASDSARIALGYAQLRAQREANELDASIKMKIDSQERLENQQRMEIDKAYKDSMVAIEQQKLQTAAADLAMKQQKESYRQQAIGEFQKQIGQPNADIETLWSKYGPAMEATIPAGIFKDEKPSGGEPREVKGKSGTLYVERDGKFYEVATQVDREKLDAAKQQADIEKENRAYERKVLDDQRKDMVKQIDVLDKIVQGQKALAKLGKKEVTKEFEQVFKENEALLSTLKTNLIQLDERRMSMNVPRNPPTPSASTNAPAIKWRLK